MQVGVGVTAGTKDDRLLFASSRPGAIGERAVLRRAGDADGYHVESVVLLVADGGGVVAEEA